MKKWFLRKLLYYSGGKVKGQKFCKCKISVIHQWQSFCAPCVIRTQPTVLVGSQKRGFVSFVLFFLFPQEKLETMLMQNSGAQTKSIVVFSEVAHSYRLINWLTDLLFYWGSHMHNIGATLRGRQKYFPMSPTLSLKDPNDWWNYVTFVCSTCSCWKSWKVS